MSDDTRQARISAKELERQLDAYGRACVALHEARHESVSAEEIWADERADIRRFLLDVFAADAAAAPAVGVTVAWLDARIDASNRHADDPLFSATHRAWHEGRADAFDSVRALLTAQPDTHDAGHVMIPAKPEGWKP